MDWTPKQRRRWRERIEWLEEEFPLPWKLHVWRVPYREQFGSATHDGREAWIRVARRLEYPAAVYVLFEEHAHLREWDDYRDHGQAWTHEYGAIIRADEDREKEEE